LKTINLASLNVEVLRERGTNHRRVHRRGKGRGRKKSKLELLLCARGTYGAREREKSHQGPLSAEGGRGGDWIGKPKGYRRIEKGKRITLSRELLARDLKSISPQPVQAREGKKGGKTAENRAPRPKSTENEKRLALEGHKKRVQKNPKGQNIQLAAKVGAVTQLPREKGS